jgi:hypothetical protein
MTIEREALVSDLFGLAGTFPRPGWVVLDAARDHRFTGELVFDTYPEVRIYVDRGRFYLAERATDASLGSRLIDAGALTAVQLEHGALRFGDDENLGRLFERVPSVDRHTVLVMTELMTDECVGWVASQKISDVSSTPYRHHVAGIHRWDRPSNAIDLSPGDSLPAPPQDEPPISVPPPEPLFNPERFVDPDDVIMWDQRSWLDDRVPLERIERRLSDRASEPAPVNMDLADALGDDQPADIADSVLDRDWIDDIESGLPEQGSDPLAPISALPPGIPTVADRFELIWPTGEIDEQFGGTDVASIEDRHPDLDRSGPTARMGRVGAELESATADPFARPDEVEQESELVLPVREPERSVGSSPDGFTGQDADDVTLPDDAAQSVDDEVLLAVRRAVASVETGSLAARTRLAEVQDDADMSRGTDVAPPGRVAVRSASSEWALSATNEPAGSVFDHDLSEPSIVEPIAEPSRIESVNPPNESSEEVSADRTSALRRLIDSLRRSDPR